MTKFSFSDVQHMSKGADFNQSTVFNQLTKRSERNGYFERKD